MGELFQIVYIVEAQRATVDWVDSPYARRATNLSIKGVFLALTGVPGY